MIFLDLIILIRFGEEYRLWRCVRFEVFTAVRVVMILMMSGFWRHVVKAVRAGVLEKHEVSIFMTKDEDSVFLRNVGI
jgi:hypothetical protein